MSKYTNYQNIVITIAVLTFVFSAGLSGVQAKARDDQPDDNIKKAEQVLESIETSSYENWKKLVKPNSGLAKKITIDDFKSFVRARELARSGKYNEALNICQNLESKLGLSGEREFIIQMQLGLNL